MSEYNALLEAYLSEKCELESQMREFQYQLQCEKMDHDMQVQVGEKNKMESQLQKDMIQRLEHQIEDKKKQGEDIYNSLRD